MCLEKCEILKKKDRPVAVYKILIDNGNGVYTSPYQHFRYEVGETYENKEEIVRLDGAIGQGLFHAYKFIEDAICSLLVFECCNNEKYVIGKFTIPEDAVVYKGECGIGVCSYGSTKVVFEEVVNRNTIISDGVLRRLRGELTGGSITRTNIWGLPKSVFDKAVEDRIDYIKTNYTEVSNQVKTLFIQGLEADVKDYYRFKGWS